MNTESKMLKSIDENDIARSIMADWRIRERDREMKAHRMMNEFLKDSRTVGKRMPRRHYPVQDEARRFLDSLDADTTVESRADISADTSRS
jgi:hypothetical protein